MTGTLAAIIIVLVAALLRLAFLHGTSIIDLRMERRLRKEDARAAGDLEAALRGAIDAQENLVATLRAELDAQHAVSEGLEILLRER